MDILAERLNPVHWDWLIYVAMFIAGLSAGAYLVAALLEVFGRGRSSLARAAQIIAFVALLIAPILLTVDLAHPERFWHMIVQNKTLMPMLKPWSPMSLGSVLLVIFGAVTFISFVDALIGRGVLSIGPWRRGRTIHGSRLGLLWMAMGAVLAAAVGAYSGVLLSVTNIPGWANSVLIGAIYVATSLRSGVAILVLVQTLRGRLDADLEALEGKHTWLIVWWLVLMVAFFATLGDGARFFLVGLPFAAMVLATVLGGLVPLALRLRARPTTAVAATSASLILLGSILVRYAIVMGPQSVH